MPIIRPEDIPAGMTEKEVMEAIVRVHKCRAEFEARERRRMCNTMCGQDVLKNSSICKSCVRIKSERR